MKNYQFFSLKLMLSFLLLFFCAIVKGQGTMVPLQSLAADTTVSFDSLMKVYKSNLFIDLGTDTGRVNKNMNRIATVWDYRTSNTFTFGFSRFSAAGKAFKDAANNRNSLCENRNPIFNGSWEFLGPKNLSFQQYGLLNDVWVNSTAPLYNDYILVATFGGIFKTTNANATGGPDWVNITDGGNNILPSGFMVNCIAVNPTNNNIIYAGTAIQLEGRGFYNNLGKVGIGIIKSTDGGATWEVDADFNTIANVDNATVTSIKFNQNGTILYALTSKGFFAQPSTTGTWQQINTSEWGRNIEPRPGNNNECWISEGGKAYSNTYHVVFTSPSTFTLTSLTSGFENLSIGGGDNMDPCWHFEISAYDANTLYAMTNREIKTIGNVQVFDPSMCCSEFTSSTTGLCIIPGPEAVLWKYNMTTAQWSMINRSSNTPHTLPSFGDGGYVFVKSKDNPDIMYFGREVMYISIDGGSTFTQISTYKSTSTTTNHADIRSIVIYHGDTGNDGEDDILYFGTDGGLGIKRSGVIPNDALDTENISGSGIGCNQFYGMASSEAGGMLLGGCMHDGTLSYEPSKTPKWHYMKSGDDFQAIFNKNNPDQAYLKNQDNNLQISGPGMSRVLYHFIDQLGHKEDRQTYITPFFNDSRGRLYWPQARLWRYENNQLTNVTAEITGVNNDKVQEIPNFNGTSQFANDNGTNIHRIAVDLDEPNNSSNNILHGYIAYQWGDNMDGAKKLFRRKVNSNETPYKWVPVTPTDAFNKKITDIQMDNANPNRVWVSLGDVTAGNTNTARVLYSDDWGDNWIDMSDGLPREIPVNCIVLHQGTDVVYAGTDIGVFMLNYDANNPSQSFWTCFNDGKTGQPNLPPNMLMKLEINHCSGKLVMASHGRGIWQSDLYIPNNNPGVTDNINANTSWTGDKYIEGSIKVIAGHTLTISGATNNPTTIHLPKYGKIIVEKGAKLIIEGATLTNSCDAMWTGIYLEADPSLRQISTSGGYYTQGYCEIKNGAIIENSENGIANYNYGTLGGGIIMAYNSIFKNNRRSLEFMKYQNKNSVGTPIADRSVFSKCTFEVNDDMHAQTPFAYHVSMWGIDGINFYGCAFKNLQTDANVPNQKGIYSIDANYNLKSACGNSNTYPCNAVLPNTFDNFDNAVESMGWSQYRPIVSDQTVFTGNQYGVLLNAVNSPVLTRNKFAIGSVTSPGWFTLPYGVAMYETPDFRM